MLHCPVDGTELRISQRNGVEIDFCPQCRGVWLDRGELEKLISQAMTDEQTRYGDPYAAGSPAKRKNDEQYYAEPPRDARRNERSYERHDDSDDDFEDRNRDRGYAPSDRDSDYPKKHKKKSLLEEVFDIFGD